MVLYIEDYDTVEQVRSLFRLLHINAKIRRLPKQDKVKITGDVEHEIVKPYVNGIMKITHGGDFVEVV